MKKCNFCQNPINDTDKFCRVCGYDPKTDAVSPDFKESPKKNIEKDEFRASGINPKVKTFLFIGLSLIIFSILYVHDFEIDGVILKFKSLFIKPETTETLISPVDTVAKRAIESEKIPELVNQTVALAPSIQVEKKSDKDKLFREMLEQFEEKQNKVYEQEISELKRRLLERYYEMEKRQQDSRRRLESQISQLKNNIADKKKGILAVRNISRKKIREIRNHPENKIYTMREKEEQERRNSLAIQKIERNEKSSLENLNAEIEVLNKRIAALRNTIASEEQRLNGEMSKIDADIKLKQREQQMELERKISEAKNLWQKGRSLKDVVRVLGV